MPSTEEYDRLAQALRQPVSQEVAPDLNPRMLIQYATLAASSHNTQPWTFRIGRGAITIAPDFTRRCPVVDPDDSHLFKSLGCAAENLVHAAAAQGFASEIRFRADLESVEVQLHRDPAVHAGVLFDAIPQRQCTRTPYDGRELSASVLAELTKAAEANGVRLILLLAEAQKEAVIDYVKQGDRAQLTDHAFRQELISWIRFNPRDALRTRDGLSGRVTGQPAVPAWLGKRILRLALRPERQANMDARHIRSSAGIAVFVSRDDTAAWVNVGRAYERFALQATALDIRNAFINQPIEVRPLRPQLDNWLGLGKDEHALLLVRFGRGPIAPFSLRRSVGDVIIDR